MMRFGYEGEEFEMHRIRRAFSELSDIESNPVSQIITLSVYRSVVLNRGSLLSSVATCCGKGTLD